MDVHSLSRVPTLSVALRPLPLPRLAALARLANRAGIPRISAEAGLFVPSRLIDRRAQPGVPVGSVWLGDPWRGLGAGPAQRERLAAWVRQLDPLLVALDLDRPTGTSSKPTGLIARVEQTRQLLGPDRRVLLALRSCHLLGGRRHLAELTALRHLAEEWDLGFALDLTCGLDPTWEAEAAIIRLGGHLRLLRIKTAATHRLAVGEDRVVARALGAAMEQAIPPEVALVATVPLVLMGSERAKVEATVTAAAVIKSRAAKASTQRAHFLSQDVWPGLRG
jgi:hypothetical protein